MWSEKELVEQAAWEFEDVRILYVHAYTMHSPKQNYGIVMI